MVTVPSTPAGSEELPYDESVLEIHAAPEGTEHISTRTTTRWVCVELANSSKHGQTEV
jgi:hypothetical protein